MTTAVQVREGGAHAEAPMEQNLLLPGDWERVQAISASSKFILPVGTAWVERDVLGIANEVAARWPNLAIASCPCGRCLETGHYPHVVMEHCKDGQTRPVFGFTRMDRDVIHRLQAIHASQNPQAKHEQLKNKARAEAKKRRDDAQREQLEVIEAALRSPKYDWRGPGGIRTNPYAGSAVKK